MREASFFQSTRGRIVESLQRRGEQTVAELAGQYGLTPNAVRQHLGRLERDGLVEEAAQRRGRTKPSSVFSLTPDGRRLFPQRYSTLLKAVLEEITETQGSEKVAELMHGIGKRSARKYAARFEGKNPQERVAELTSILREQGVVADYEASRRRFRAARAHLPVPRHGRDAPGSLLGRAHAHGRSLARESGAAQLDRPRRRGVRILDPRRRRQMMDFPKFQELVTNRTGFAQMPDPTATGEYFSDSCGDMYTFYLKVGEGERIDDISYFTTGCGFGVATCAILTELAKGKTIEEAARITPADIEAYLGGYPERKKDYPERVLETLRITIENYRKGTQTTTAAEAFSKIS